MDCYGRLNAAKVATTPFADVVRSMRKGPVAMLDLGVAPVNVSPHVASELADMLRALPPNVVMKVCAGMGGVQVTTRGTVFYMVLKGVHPDVYMYPMLMTPEQMRVTPLPAKYFKLAVIDAAMTNDVSDVSSVWDGRKHTFARVPKLHKRSNAVMEADIRHAVRFAKYRVPLADLSLPPPAPSRRWTPYRPNNPLCPNH